MPKLADLTYAHTLTIESTHEYKVFGPYGSDLPCPIWLGGGHLFLRVHQCHFAPNPEKTKMATLGPYGTWKVGTIWPMDLVFTSTFNDQSMNIGYISKFRQLSGSL